MSRFTQECKKHGPTEYVREIKNPKQVHCRKCRIESNRKARRIAKLKLIDKFGGQCVICGYKKCAAALEFHHTDPTSKSFHLGQKGTINISSCMKELVKCVLICSNCHREVESGITSLPQ